MEPMTSVGYKINARHAMAARGHRAVSSNAIAPFLGSTVRDSGPAATVGFAASAYMVRKEQKELKLCVKCQRCVLSM